MEELIWFLAGAFWTVLGVYAMSAVGDPDNIDHDPGGSGTILFMLTASVFWPLALPLMRLAYRVSRRK